MVSYTELYPLQHFKSLEESSWNKMQKIYYLYGDPMFNMNEATRKLPSLWGDKSYC